MKKTRQFNQVLVAFGLIFYFQLSLLPSPTGEWNPRAGLLSAFYPKQLSI